MKLEGRDRLVGLDATIAQIREGGGDPVSWNPSQRALLAAEHVATAHGGKRRDKGAKLGVMWFASHDMVASSMGVSARLVRMGVRLLRHGDAELIDAVREGEMRLTFADQLVSEAEARRRVLAE